MMSVAVVAVSSCTDETLVAPEVAETTEQTTSIDTKDLVAFSAASPLTRTEMESDGKFYWVSRDNVFVEKSAGVYSKSVSTSVTAKQAEAEFYFQGHFTQNNYDVFYTGRENTNNTNGESPDKVTIEAVQHQHAPNESVHLGEAGDCGVAVANKVSESNYSFTLDHKATYLVFKPGINAATPLTGNYCHLLRIKVEDLGANNTLVGNFDFSKTGLAAAANGITGGNTAELYLTDRLQPDGVTIDENVNPNFDFADPADKYAYMVVHPGTYQLKVTYTLAYYKLQSWTFNETDNRYEFTYEDQLQSFEVTIPSTDFAAGSFYTIQHDIDLVEPGVAFTFNFDSYFMWNGQDKFANFFKDPADPTDPRPVMPTANNMTVTGIPLGDMESSASYTHDNVINDSQASPSNSIFTKGTADREMPNPNQLTYYLVYGDIHRDNDIIWKLEGFTDDHGHSALCRGGIWMLKSENITPIPFSNPSDNPANSLKTRWGTNPVVGYNAFDAYARSGGNDLRRWGIDNYYDDNSSFRIRFNTFDDAHKTTPVDVDKYFFLPYLGFFMTSDEAGGTVRVQLKSVGAEGMYWTKNRHIYSDYYTVSGERQRTAFCLYVNNKPETFWGGGYVTLKWVQSGYDYFRRFGLIANNRPDGTGWFK